MDWASSVENRIRQRQTEQITTNDLDLLRLKSLNEQAAYMGERLTRQAKEAVQRISPQPAFRELSFSEIPHGFKVQNLLYPAVWTEVKLFSSSICFESKHAKNANSNVFSSVDRIELQLDRNGNLTAMHDGCLLATEDDILNVILSPAFRL